MAPELGLEERGDLYQRRQRPRRQRRPTAVTTEVSSRGPVFSEVVDEAGGGESDQEAPGGVAVPR